MSYFKSKIIRGISYSLGHLDPFEFELDVGDVKRNLSVRFHCHCFTERLESHHTPDLHYTHKGETRAFDFTRYELSRNLPALIASLGTRSVYLTRRSNYFTLRDMMAGPYLVFFNVAKAKRKGIDVLMNVESAYVKHGMAERASPVRFTTLIEKTSLGQAVTRGPPQTIKRK